MANAEEDIIDLQMKLSFQDGLLEDLSHYRSARSNRSFRIGD